MAQVFLSHGLTDAAIIAFEEALKLDPSNGISRMVLGRIFATKDVSRLEEAVLQLEEAYDSLIEMSDNGNPVIEEFATSCKLFSAAIIAESDTFSLQERKNALSLLESSLRDNISMIKLDNLAHYATVIVNSYYNLGDYKRAIKKAREYCSLDLADASIDKLNSLIARSQIKLNADDDSLQVLREIASKHRLESIPQFELAIALFETNKIDEAAIALEEALVLNPCLQDAHFLRGKIYLAKNKLDEAKKDFSLFVKESPEAPYGYYQLGLLEAKRDNKIKCVEYFETALTKWKSLQVKSEDNEYFLKHPLEVKALKNIESIARKFGHNESSFMSKLNDLKVISKL